FQIFISLCHFFQLLFILPSKKPHPLHHIFRSAGLFLKFRKLQDLNLQLICILLPGHFIPEMDRPVTEIIIWKSFKIQDADLNTLLQDAIAFPCLDRKSTRLNSSHVSISYAVFCLKKKKYEL